MEAYRNRSVKAGGSSGDHSEYEELQALTDRDLIERYNKAAERTEVGTGFYTDEENSKDPDKSPRHLRTIPSG